MRPFFIVGVKLIGILVLYWALQHIAPIVSSVRSDDCALTPVPLPLSNALAAAPARKLRRVTRCFVMSSFRN